MFLRDPSFLLEEKAAPILDRNDEYLQPEIAEQIIERTSNWVKLVGGQKGFVVKDVVAANHESQRIIIHDAERTYIHPKRRKTLVKILSSFENQFGDYAQGLALVSGFLLMSLSEQDVASIVSVLATNQKYIPEYWRTEAIAAARDAFVWDYLLQRHIPEISAHLKKKGVMPQTFCQKWFVALTINVLPFAALYRFFELFLEQGFIFLFKFGLSLVSTFKDILLKSPDYEIYKILRYDKELPNSYEISNDTIHLIVEKAANFQLIDFDVKSVREKVFKQYLEGPLERARLAQQKAQQKKKESSSDDSGSEEGAECDLCEKNVPDMWCLVCKKMICEKCHSSNAGGTHKSSHKVDEKWEKYEDAGNNSD